MSGVIYTLQDDGQLVEMSEKSYDSEDLLQRLLASYPALMAGDQIDSAAPRQWLLVSREFGVPSEEEGGGRWSLDHLFLDQDAIPTLVEVKRSSDTRIRREVVGQMLDYAANAVVYWPIDRVRGQFEATCERGGLDPEQALAEFLGGDSDQEEFWQKAKTNLQAGRVRMLFVADEIPSELRRIVEFLNTQMDPAEVLALEIKQYVGENVKTMVPRLIGQTAAAEQKKSTAREGRQWDEASFFEALGLRCKNEEVAVAKKLLEWSTRTLSRIWWGRGTRSGSFIPMLDHSGTAHFLFAVWTYGSVEIQFQHMRPPFEGRSKREELRSRLNSIAGMDISDTAVTRRPSIPLSALVNKASLEQFLEAFNWVAGEIRAS